MLERSTVDKELNYASVGNRHKSVRLVTAQRILEITDHKTAVLKRIHKLCNEILEDYENGDGDKIYGLVKEIRFIAGQTYPKLEPETTSGTSQSTV
jgi:hypothetical protein